MSDEELMVYNVGLRVVVVKRDAVLPPVTSKVLKQVLETRGGLLGSLAASRQPYKPLMVSMLYRGSRPLYSTAGREKPVTVREGEELWARIGFVAPPGVFEEITGLAGEWKTSYGSFYIEVTSINALLPEAIRISNSGGGPTGVLRVEAKTPTIISNKVLVVVGSPDVAKKVPQAHKLVPSPGAIVAYAFRLWNTVFNKTRHIIYFRDGWNRDAALLSRAAEIWMAEVNYRFRPETVIIGGGNGLRKARGWRGWVVYRVHGKRLAKYLDRILGLANILGLGRSRGLGLGDVTISWIKSSEQEE